MRYRRFEKPVLWELPFFVGIFLSLGTFSIGGSSEAEAQEKTTAQETAELYGWPYVAGHLGLAREEIVFPKVAGYQVLKGDFHIHTIYSDGQVLPETRVWEAWRDGLDILSITDHPEYQRMAFPEDPGRAYERAKPLAEALGVMLIRGAELTTLSSSSYMPTDSDYVVNFIDDEAAFYSDFDTAIQSARDQGATIIWAHPGPNWVPDAEALLRKGWLDGIELRNSHWIGGKGTHYYRRVSLFKDVMDWCLENDLAVFAVSDAHWPIDQMVDKAQGQRRDMTLILAKQANPQGVREAIKQRRTLAYFEEMLWGKEKWLRALAESSLELKVTPTAQSGRRRHFLGVTNRSSFPFQIQFAVETSEVLHRSREFRLRPNTTTMLPFSAKKKVGNLKLTIRVTNLLSGTDRPLVLEREVSVPGPAT